MNLSPRQLDILRRASLSELAMIRVRWPGWLPARMEARADREANRFSSERKAPHPFPAYELEKLAAERRAMAGADARKGWKSRTLNTEVMQCGTMQ